MDAEFIVPGDVLMVRLGDIVPADIKLLGSDDGEEHAPMQVRHCPAEHNLLPNSATREGKAAHDSSAGHASTMPAQVRLAHASAGQQCSPHFQSYAGVGTSPICA